MKFIDSAKLFVRSGKGGDGCLAFLHEKYREFGGPSGGNGGRGGDVIVCGSAGLYTLFDLNLNPHQNAGAGSSGSGKNQNGRSGSDLLLRLPLGTQIFDFETGEMLCDVNSEEPKILLEGGRGGLGNHAFKSNWNRAPRQFTKGQPGIEKILKLELKLIADGGLVGFPNAGKSTFISKVSAARPKIADYPFTTLKPNLGTITPAYYKSYVIADIPGLIEGASEGKGLGHQFLRHVERTKVLIFLLEMSDFAELDPIKAYTILCNELDSYSSALNDKPRFILLTKCDYPFSDKEEEKRILSYFEDKGLNVFRISSLTGENISLAIAAIGKKVSELRGDLIPDFPVI